MCVKRHSLSTQAGADASAIDCLVDLHHVVGVKSLHLANELSESDWCALLDVITNLSADLLQ